MPSRSQTVQNDFPFYTQLLSFYQQNRTRIRQQYAPLTRKFLDFNDPANATAFLRLPQFQALELYVFLKEFLDNQPLHQIFREWADNSGRFSGRSVVQATADEKVVQPTLTEGYTTADFEAVYAHLRSYGRAYPNYIFALTMGTGKTILMATCIFYEFLLANKYPTDPRYCHNALVFAPDTTVLQSLREIQTFDMARVVPPEYVGWLQTNITFHYLDEAGMALSVLDGSRFNLIVSNTQKVILKRQHKDKSPMERLLSAGRPTFTPGSVYEQYADLYGDDTLDSDDALTTNQRFQKLQRLRQLGIYVDEAHHAFGKQLADDMGKGDARTSLRLTIDELAASLTRTGTHVVACFNYTGTPYAQDRILPEVVYAFGLKEAIQREYLKQVYVNDYTNARTPEFVRLAIDDFLAHNPAGQRHEGMLPKIAFFAATIDELRDELYPAVEAALLAHGIPTSRMLINVGDPKLTTNDDIREFNRLDTPASDKQFILLVNKGREGWNCRSLFAVALYRKPKSKIFVLQASMRCLRAITDAQQIGRVYLSDENRAILDAELEQNFRVTVADLQPPAHQREVIQVHVTQPVEKITLTRVRRLFQMRERQLARRVTLDLAHATTDQYRITRTEHEGLTADARRLATEDVTHIRARRAFSRLTLVAEIARYLNRSCIDIDRILAESAEGFDVILAHVNDFNELLYDWVIPHLFTELYEVSDFEHPETYQVELVRVPTAGFYELRAQSDLIIRANGQGIAPHAAKSFHLDAYCFDSRPERDLFWKLLGDGRIKKVYFTGMLTHGQSEFYVQYIDPTSHTIRTYYPDFLVQRDDGHYVIVEVKRDDQVEEPVVRAKKDFAEQLATASDMTYCLIPGSRAARGQYEVIWDAALQETYLSTALLEGSE